MQWDTYESQNATEITGFGQIKKIQLLFFWQQLFVIAAGKKKIL